MGTTEIGSAAVCGSKSFERRTVPIPFTAAHTTHPPSWCDTGEIVPGWNEDFTALWKEATEEANLREWEKQAAARHVYLHLLSGNVAQIPAGPPLTRGGAVSKQAKEFANFLHDLGRDYLWSILCLQEFTASNGDVVTETAEGHRVFATPPREGQRRLAIVVAAETLPFVVGGSFLCEREELRS